MNLQERLNRLQDKLGSSFKVYEKEAYAVPQSALDDARTAAVTQWLVSWEWTHKVVSFFWHLGMLAVILVYFVGNNDWSLALSLLCYDVFGTLVLAVTKALGRRYAKQGNHDMLCAIVESSFAQVREIYPKQDLYLLPNDVDTALVNSISATMGTRNVYLYCICMGVKVVTLIHSNTDLNDDNVGKSIDIIA